MSDIVQFNNEPEFKQKSFWKRPEGVTGMIFMLALVAGGGFLIYNFWPLITQLLANTLSLFATIALVGILVYMIVDPKTRTLISYMYKSAMRWITGLFVQLDPIGILKSYVEDLEKNLSKLRQQIGKLRGQMRHLQGLMEKNDREIEQQMQLAAAAKAQDKNQQMILSSRKAARLKESNKKYQELLQKIEILYRILQRMDASSEVLLEDTRDQVRIKEQERKAIRASHSAMKSAMSVMSGDPDKRAMFDAAMEAVADDVATKVGEMERFMEMSANVMDSVDLQNGIVEEKGLKMLEAWEQESALLLESGSSTSERLELKNPGSRATESTTRSAESKSEGYDNFFN